MNFTIELTASPALLEALKLMTETLQGFTLSGESKTRKSPEKKERAAAAPVAPAPLPAAESIPVPEECSGRQEGKAEEVSAAAPVTVEQVRAAVQAKAQEGKRGELRNLLDSYGVKNVSSLEPEKYGEFYAELMKL